MFIKLMPIIGYLIGGLMISYALAEVQSDAIAIFGMLGTVILGMSLYIWGKSDG